MKAWLQAAGKIRFYLIAGVLNLGSVALLLRYNGSVTSSRAVTVPAIHGEVKQETVIGKPVRLRIPSLNIELPIDEGHYNPADASWTLSGYQSHFAMPTMRANNEHGNTLVYGHNNKYVFGPLKQLQPGALAEVLTDNGHLFYYTFESSSTVAPDDLSIFTYEGPPILTLQTCTGNWHELRTLSRFKLTRTIKFNPNAERDRASREKLMAELQNMTNPAFPEVSVLTD